MAKQRRDESKEGRERWEADRRGSCREVRYIEMGTCHVLVKYISQIKITIFGAY